MSDMIRRADAWEAVRGVITSKDWTDCDGDVFCDAIEASLRALPAVEVGIKPLKWERSPDTHESAVVEFADSQFGGYVAWGGGAWGLGWPDGAHHLPPVDGESLEAAKAAAQADYEARIRSAMTATPAQVASIEQDATNGLESCMPQDVAERRLYLDLDGVIADFDAHFPAVFGCDHRGMADDAMWEKINSHPSYFEDMPLCQGAEKFFANIRYMRPIILTACPRTNYAHVAGQKRRWVQRHLGRDVTVIPVMGGHNKCLFMHAPGDVLIDDYAKNCVPWEKMGGVAIHHTSFAETSAALARMKVATHD